MLIYKINRFVLFFYFVSQTRNRQGIQGALEVCVCACAYIKADPY